MGVMSRAEAIFCRSAPWLAVAGRVVLPWAEGGAEFAGRVLEVGSGGGAMAAHLLARHPEIDRLTALDIDPTMVRTAGERLRGFGARAGAEPGDGTTLPFADGSFDAVCSWLMLHHTLDWSALLDEAHRVLAPGGWLVGYDIAAAPLGRVLHGASRSEVRLVRPRDLALALTRLGFTDVGVDPVLAGQFFRFRARRRSEVAEDAA